MEVTKKRLIDAAELAEEGSRKILLMGAPTELQTSFGGWGGFWQAKERLLIFGARK